jgi:hypothetical protein
MRIMRLVGMLLIAVVAMSFVVVSSATAAESPNPLFVPANNQALTGSGGASSLSAAGITVGCKENHVISGNVSNSLLIGNIVLHYLGCTLTAGGEEATGCPVNSTGFENAGGLILTNTLHAILGIELPANRTVVVFLPQTPGSKVFVNFLESTLPNGKKCSVATSVTGSLAGLIEPVGVPRTTFLVLLGGPPRLVHLTHNLGLVTAKLVAFSETGELTQTEEVESKVETEVT